MSRRASRGVYAKLCEPGGDGEGLTEEFLYSFVRIFATPPDPAYVYYVVRIVNGIDHAPVADSY